MLFLDWKKPLKIKTKKRKSGELHGFPLFCRKKVEKKRMDDLKLKSGD